MHDTLEIAPETTTYLNLALSKFEKQDAMHLDEAVRHALSLHAHQARRPSGETYGNHILRVAARLVNDFEIIDRELLIAGLYHDAVEDQLEKLCQDTLVSRDNAYGYLTDRFSQRVSDAVRGVSNPESLDEIQDREARNSKYIAHVIEECDKNPDCFLIKLSDFFDNAMRIQFNKTDEDKVRGAKKYLPLFDYYYGRLGNGTSVITPELRKILQKRIVSQKEYLMQLIRN